MHTFDEYLSEITEAAKHGASATELEQITKNHAEARQKQIKEQTLKAELDKIRSGYNRISFCTNAMVGRGTVFHCHVDENYNAVIDSTQSWWAMSYSEQDKSKAGQILGKIEKCYLPNHGGHFKVGHLCEGRG